MDEPIKNISAESMNAILYGMKDKLVIPNNFIGVNIDYSMTLMEFAIILRISIIQMILLDLKDGLVIF